MIMEVSLEPLMVEDTFSPCDGKVWERIDGRLQRIEPTVDVMAVAKVSATAVATVVEAEMSEVVVYGRWPSQQGNAAYMQRVAGKQRVTAARRRTHRWQRAAAARRRRGRVRPATSSIREPRTAMVVGVG